MKKLLFLIALLCITIQANSQASRKDSTALPLYNLFQLAKYMNANGLKNHQMDQVYYTLTSILDRSQRSKTTEESSQKLRLNFIEDYDALKINIIKKDINNNIFDIPSVEKKLQLNPNSTNKHRKDLLQEVITHEQNVNKLKEENQKLPILSNLKGKLDGHQFTLARVDTVKSKTEIDSIRNVVQKDIEDIKKQNIHPIKGVTLNDTIISLQKAIADTISKHEKTRDSLKSMVDSFSTKSAPLIAEYAKVIFDEIKKSNKTSLLLNFSSQGFESSSEKSTQIIQVQSTIQQAEQNSRSSFSLPSESDLIQAMAIFLANRAKQETVIWFLDRLKQDINNPFVYDAFPNTHKMLIQQTNFNNPDFGSAWRLAFAEDFIHLPSNLIASDWIDRNWSGSKEKLDELKVTVGLGQQLLQLVHKQYSYRDIIKHFHLNPAVPDTSKLNYINQIFDNLYILTNEFFMIDNVDTKPTYRLLSYEELSSLTEEEINTLSSLIEIKYGSYFKRKDGRFPDLRKISSLLLTLSQFDKIAKQDQGGQEPGQKNNFWEFMDQNILQIKNTFEFKPEEVRVIDNFKSALSIYKHIYQKNFDVALDTLLGILQKEVFKQGISVKILTSGEIVLEVEGSNSKEIKIPSSNKNGRFKPKEEIKLKIQNGNITINDESSISIEEVKKAIKFLKYASTANKKDKEHYIKLGIQDPTYKFWDSLLRKLNPDLFVGNEKGNKQIYDYDRLVLIGFLIEFMDNPMEALRTPIYSEYAAEVSNDYLKNRGLHHLAKLKQVTSFFSDISNSTDEKSLAAAIDRNVLPATSYRMKRESKFSISINGYVGPYAGVQWVINPQTDYNNGWIYGITAPVGFTFSGRNQGIFLQVLDLGNLVNQYLWQSDPEIDEEKLKVRQIISPGINFMKYLKNSPFVFFVGANYVMTETSEKPKGSLNLFQYKAGIQVDIPIINLNR
ncbi:hypothetical protein [Sphingobacterium kyonggiense]